MDGQVQSMTTVCGQDLNGTNKEMFFFSIREYLLGDSAFKPSDIMIPAFKKPFGSNLDHYKSYFNTSLARTRITSEHCIGILKGRFQVLKRIRVIIKDGASQNRVNRLIMTCSILHNIMIAEPCPDEWIDSCDNELLDADELNEEASTTSDQRRQQLFAYLLEKHR